MKTTCPKCGTRHAVPEEAILRQIERAKSLRDKAARILGRLTGGKTRLNAEERRMRAIKAVRAREEKRRENTANEA